MNNSLLKLKSNIKKYALLLLSCNFFLPAERGAHENHVLQNDLAQLDHHLEMEFTSTGLSGRQSLLPGLS